MSYIVDFSLWWILQATLVLRIGVDSQPISSALGHSHGGAHSGWGAPSPIIAASSTGLASLSGIQESNSGQAFSLHAVGQGMNISLNSNVGYDASTNMTQEGAQVEINPLNGETTVESTETSINTLVSPQSQFELDLQGADEINVGLQNYATGGEHLDSLIQQVTDAVLLSPPTDESSTGGWSAEPK